MHTFTYVLKIFVIYDMINLGRTKEGGNEGFKKGYNKRWKEKRGKVGRKLNIKE